MKDYDDLSLSLILYQLGESNRIHYQDDKHAEANEEDVCESYYCKDFFKNQVFFVQGEGQVSDEEDELEAAYQNNG